MEQDGAGGREARFDYSDQVALVTGSTKGIGLAIADALSAAGARVVLNGRDAAALDAAVADLRAKGRDVVGFRANVRDFDAVLAMVEETERRYGRLDIVVNNVGGVFACPLETLSPNGWRAMLETNLTSAFHCSTAALPLLRRTGGGVIINISSVAGDHAHPLRAAYGAAKAGLNSLTKSMAHEWAPYRIRVNGVAPGPILTEASRFADPMVAAAVQDDIPLGRLGVPADVTGACLFLASDAASFVTGVTLRVDGGPPRSLPKSAEPAVSGGRS